MLSQKSDPANYIIERRALNDVEFEYTLVYWGNALKNTLGKFRMRFSVFEALINHGCVDYFRVPIVDVDD